MARRISGVGSNSLNFDLGMVTEIHDVLSGLNAFKTELLQLHAVVSVCVCVCCVHVGVVVCVVCSVCVGVVVVCVVCSVWVLCALCGGVGAVCECACGGGVIFLAHSNDLSSL